MEVSLTTPVQHNSAVQINDQHGAPDGLNAPRSSAVENRAGRNLALDFTKGLLVLLMVLYHWINYFVSQQGDFSEILRFITPSFIFITGFLIANVYLAKYAIDDPRLYKRLIQEGSSCWPSLRCSTWRWRFSQRENPGTTSPGMGTFLRNVGSTLPHRQRTDGALRCSFHQLPADTITGVSAAMPVASKFSSGGLWAAFFCHLYFEIERGCAGTSGAFYHWGAGAGIGASSD